MADDQTQDNLYDQPGGISPLLVILLITGLLGVIAAVMMVLNEGQSASSDDSGFAQITTPVPPRSLDDWQADDFLLTTLDGSQMSLADYRGRTVFLNFWRTDCPPCVREMPAMQEFMRDQGDDGAVVLAVNQGEDAGDVREFLADLGITDIPILLDPDVDLRTDYPYSGLPTTYVIAPDGRVTFQKIGEFTLTEMNTYLDATLAGG